MSKYNLYIEVPPELIRVDRTVRPAYPSWMREVLHPELETTGPVEFDCAKLDLWLHRAQKNGPVRGQVIYDHLKSENMLSSCLGLCDLKEIQKKDVIYFRKHFKDQAVFGWKSVIRPSNVHFEGSSLSVPCLVESIGRVVLNWHQFDDRWSSTSPALRFA